MKKTTILFLIACLSLATKATDIRLADPTVFCHDGVYYLTGTGEVDGGFTLYTSEDLVHWTPKAGLAADGRLMHNSQSFGSSKFWAPQIFRVKDSSSFGLAYAADEKIAIAYADDPHGPFKQEEIGAIDPNSSMIDPFYFVDDNGKQYLYYVRVDGSNSIYVADLSDNRQSLSNAKQCVSATYGTWQNVTNGYAVAEGPTVFKDGDYYYLVYSCNDYRNINYAVGYAYATSPKGPWTKVASPILTRHHLGLNGTGHGDIFCDKEGQMWYVFHVHNNKTVAETRRTALIPFTLTDNPDEKFCFDYSRAFILQKDAQTEATLPESATIFTVDSITYQVTSATSCAVTFPEGKRFGYKGNIVIPETVTYDNKTYIVDEIGHDAFYKSSANSISLPSSIKKVGYNAFEGCNRLSDIFLLGETPPETDLHVADFGTLHNVMLNVPDGSKLSFQRADGWKEFLHIKDSQPEEEKALLTPTMGWSSWNTYGININENLIKQQANACVNRGFADAGYQYINIDDGYFYHHDESDGHLLIHPQKFPNGLKPLVDYIHSKNLKAGIYTDAGDNTCASAQGTASWGDPWGMGSGIWQHEQQDMDFWFVDCGFDFIKVDYCGASRLTEEGYVTDEEERYSIIAAAMRAAAAKAGRSDLRMNICRWSFPGTWAYDIAGSWRTTGDIYNDWVSVKGIIDENIALSAFCREGHYNDMDMLEVGRGMSEEEDKTHFGMWCIMDSPLLIGCDMSNVSEQARKLMTNSDLIAINQDSLHLQAYPAYYDGHVYTMVKDFEQLFGTKRVVALYNPTDNERTTKLKWESIDLAGTIKMRDLFEQKDLSDCTATSFSVTIPAHATRIYLVEGEERLERTCYEAETAYLSDFSKVGKNDVASWKNVSGFSCGKGVGWLGRRANNDLQWQNVWSKEGGQYKIVIYFASQDTRKIFLQVNDGQPKSKNCNSGSWTRTDSWSTFIDLEPGLNTIRLYNESNWMPDIDYMTLKCIVPASVEPITDSRSNAPKYIVDMLGRVVCDPSLLPSGTIYIEGNQKRIAK